MSGEGNGCLRFLRGLMSFLAPGMLLSVLRLLMLNLELNCMLREKNGKFHIGRVVDVPAIEPFIRLRVGDLLVISRDSLCEQDELPGPTCGAHRIGCSSGFLFDSVKIGDPIAFDDGKIWGVIQRTSISEILVSITHAGPRGAKLGSEKSINFPESNVWAECLTSKDLMDLDFVAAHADMVGVSFVRDVHDIVVLHQELEKRKLRKLGIVLKIETKSAFEKLPLMLLEAMKSSIPLGVMIARGDLAVECGWEKLADMQEEILSVCGAAHIPVICQVWCACQSRDNRCGQWKEVRVTYYIIYLSISSKVVLDPNLFSMGLATHLMSSPREEGKAQNILIYPDMLSRLLVIQFFRMLIPIYEHSVFRVSVLVSRVSIFRS
jgi:pyruvate kinase